MGLAKRSRLLVWSDLLLTLVCPSGAGIPICWVGTQPTCEWAWAQAAGLCDWRALIMQDVRIVKLKWPSVLGFCAIQLWGGATHVGSWVWWHKGLGRWERCPQWCDKEWPTEVAEVHPPLILKASQTSPKSHGILDPEAPHSLSFPLLTTS